MSAPTVKTAGKIGDTYLDKDTGKYYICKSIYRNSVGIVEYTWEEVIDVVKETEEEEIKPTPTPDPEPTPEPSVNKPRNYYSKQYNKRSRN